MKGPDLGLLSDSAQVRLNDELLAGDATDKEPRRNSKDDLIRKINILCSENNLILEESNTKLRRMTKSQLQEALAKYAELCMQAEMARQVGAKMPPGASPGSIDTVAGGASDGARPRGRDAREGRQHRAAEVRLPAGRFPGFAPGAPRPRGDRPVP